MHACVLRKVDLPPPALRSQLSNSVAKTDADIPCHPYYGGDILKGASTLSYGEIACRERFDRSPATTIDTGEETTHRRTWGGGLSFAGIAPQHVHRSQDDRRP